MALKNETEKLVKAVMANRVKEVKQIIEEGNFDPVVLQDVFKALKIKGDFSVPPIPLYYLSLCNQIYLSDDNWDESCRPTIDCNREGCKALIAYWEESGYDVASPIDFSRYSDLVAYYNCYDYESLLGGTEAQLVALGYDKEEAELCYALASYDQATIYRLLDKGVNPDVWIDGNYTQADSAEQEEGSNGLMFVDCAFNVDPQLDGLLDYYFTDPLDELEEPTPLIFHTLFMGAAYKLVNDHLHHLALTT